MSVVRTCSKCGATYECRKIHMPMRDRDFVNCDICETKLFGWNGAEMWETKLMSKGNTKEIE